MRTKTKRRIRKSKVIGLFGIPAQTSNKMVDTLKVGGLTLASAIAGGGVGAALGKHSFVAGIPIIFLGAYKSNRYITAAGLGLCLANGFQSKTQVDNQTSGVDGALEGFGLEQVKDRVGTYFKNFSEKLYLPQSKKEDGVNGFSEDVPSYFINPHHQQMEGGVDMSQLDRVQMDIANMGSLDSPERIL